MVRRTRAKSQRRGVVVKLPVFERQLDLVIDELKNYLAQAVGEGVQAENVELLVTTIESNDEDTCPASFLSVRYVRFETDEEFESRNRLEQIQAEIEEQRASDDVETRRSMYLKLKSEFEPSDPLE